MNSDQIYTHSLSAINLLILAAIAEKPMHAYGIREHIIAFTLWQVAPHTSSIRYALKRFEQDGWIRAAWQEPSKASRYERVVYEITDRGWQVLRTERRSFQHVIQWVERLEARQRALENFMPVITASAKAASAKT
jgi:DNA-binding PadR family transcriptional regulator